MIHTRVLAALAATTIALGLLAGTRLPGEGPERPVTTAPPLSSTPAPPEPPTPLALAPAPAPVVPAEVSIPHLGINADVIPVGITADAEMQVPEDIRDIGWYVPTAPESFDAGSTVLVGHRDGATDPNGVFRKLGTLDPGRRIRITDSRGQAHVYRVRSVTSVPDAEFTRRARELFVSEGDPRLVLLTCGGAYVRAKGGYQSTVIVIATPE